MIDAQVRRLAVYFFRTYPGRTALMIALMVAAGTAEGIGVVALVPVLEVAQDGGAGNSTISRLVGESLLSLGVEPTLGALLVAIVIALTLKAALLYASLKQVGFTQVLVAENLRLRLIDALLHAKWSHTGTQATGKYAGSINYESSRASSAYREGCTLLASVIQVAAYLVVAALLSWRVAAFAIALGVSMTWLMSGLFTISQRAGAAQTGRNKELVSRLVDLLRGIKPLKAMARESLVWPLLKAESDALSEAQKIQVVAAERLKLFQEPTIVAFLVLGLYLAIVVGGQPLSEVLVLAFIFYRIMRHVSGLQMRYQMVLVGQAAFSNMMDDIEQAEAEREALIPSRERVHLRTAIVLDEVWVSYGSNDVLRGVDMRIPVGTFVALMGESGAGKTTLADLVVGLREPGRGRVLVDDTPLPELNLVAWRQSIGYVPQDLLLFNDTIRRNVTLGDPALSDEDVERALRLAGAWGFVKERSNGLDELVGEQGVALSGGQRQRIAIARALAPRPALLVLDEVTTALDPATEREVCATLRGLAGEVTILAISHQSAISEVADVAYDLRNGQLMERSLSASRG